MRKAVTGTFLLLLGAFACARLNERDDMTERRNAVAARLERLRGRLQVRSEAGQRSTNTSRWTDSTPHSDHESQNRRSVDANPNQGEAPHTRPVLAATDNLANCGRYVSAVKYRQNGNSWPYFPDYLQTQVQHVLERSLKEMQRLTLFFGYPRSGHSLIGSLLDAHGQIIIGSEFDVMSFTQLPDVSSKLLLEGIIRNSLYCGIQGRSQAGYNFAMAGFYAGKVDPNKALTVIGDKKGGNTTRYFVQDFSGAFSHLRSTMTTLRVPLHVIHIVRNPFDMIATQVARGLWDQMAEFDEYRYSKKEDGSLFPSVHSRDIPNDPPCGGHF